MKEQAHSLSRTCLQQKQKAMHAIDQFLDVLARAIARAHLHRQQKISDGPEATGKPSALKSKQ